MKNKIIGIDLDGTLISRDKIIKKDDLKTIRKLFKDNIILFNTGRNYFSAENILVRNFGIDIKTSNIYLASSNGSSLDSLKPTKNIYTQKIKLNTVIQIIKIINDFGGEWNLWQGNTIVTSNSDINWYFYEIKQGFTCLEGESNIAEDIEKVDVSIKGIKNDVAFFEILKKIEGIKYVYYPTKKYVEINCGVDKSKPIEFLKKMYPNKKIISIGDNFNDIPAFLVSDFSVVIGKRNEAIVKHADFNSVEQYECGITKFIQWWEKNEKN